MEFSGALFDERDHVLGPQAEAVGLAQQGADEVLGERGAVFVDEQSAGAFVTNIPMPRRFSNTPLSTSRLMPFAAVAGLME